MTNCNFDTVLINEGSAFNVSTFTAPYTGYYYMALSLGFKFKQFIVMGFT